ncbi:unnamed protein product [Cylicocyclus nassatus]|uniref:Major facilitator superfamily (MFS) profile domain-containing protein n=1 Tax=Cylicocyclus nassatus TaxID=53992 RepID=A0AA36HF56_CYLNA|nr:unnamed protein product [Cylicocyclus nassatus]
MVPTVVAASMGIGILFGVLWIVPLIDTRGRKFVAVHIRCVLGIISCTLQALAGCYESAELFVMGQLILGILIPIDMVIIPIFVIECAPDRRRGFASVVLHMGRMLGVLLMYWMCLPRVLGTYEKWFLIPAIGLLLSILLYVTTAGIRDSPKWLTACGRRAEAMTALQYYQGRNENQEELARSLSLEFYLTTAKNMNLKAVWRDVTVKEALKVIIAIQMMFTLSPITVERAYSVIVHTSLGLTVEQSLVLSWISTLLLSPLILLSSFALDKFGRRPVVFVAATILFMKTVFMFTAQLLVYFTSTSWITRYAAVINEFSTDFVFCTGAGTVSSLLVAELVPPAARVAVAQVLLFVALLSSVPIATPFPILNAVFAPAIYVPMLLCQPIIIVYLFRNLPETKLLPVSDNVHNFEEEIRSRTDTLLSEKTPLIKSRSGTGSSLVRRTSDYASPDLIF